MKDRIIEMLERGERVELECVDRYGFEEFFSDNKKILQLSKIIIAGYDEVREGFDLAVDSCELNNLNLRRSNAFICDSELERFKIKEPADSFNDLIDVAVKAWKDGYLKVLELEKGIVDHVLTVIDGIAYGWQDGDYDYSHAIDTIKSLYTETFVIESESDIERVKVGALIELSNGNSDRAMLTDKYSGQSRVQFSENKHWGAVGLFILKGATVTQKRGSQCNK